MKNLTKIFLSIVLILVLPAMIYGQGTEKAVHIDVEGFEPGTKTLILSSCPDSGNRTVIKNTNRNRGFQRDTQWGKTSFTVKRMAFSTTFACTTIDSVH